MKPIADRIAAADPLRVDLTALPDEAGQALAREILKQEDKATSGRVRRRSLGYLAGLVAAAVIAVPAVAVAGVAAYQGIHSGVFGEGGEAVAGEEFYYTDAPEIVTVLHGLTAEFPLPAGASYDQLLARYPMTERILVQRTGLGQQVQITAACAWYRDWLDGDAPQRAADQPTIDAIPTWKYWVFPESGTPGEGAPPSVHPGTQPADDTTDPGRSMLDNIAAETRSGRDATLKQYLTANC